MESSTFKIKLTIPWNSTKKDTQMNSASHPSSQCYCMVISSGTFLDFIKFLLMYSYNSISHTTQSSCTYTSSLKARPIIFSLFAMGVFYSLIGRLLFTTMHKVLYTQQHKSHRFQFKYRIHNSNSHFKRRPSVYVE